MSVSVRLPARPCSSSEPISRMLRRSLPSHGGRVWFGTGVPTGEGRGDGEGTGDARLAGQRLVTRARLRRGRRVVAVGRPGVVEDAADEVHRLEVVARDRDVGAGQDEADRGQSGDGDRPSSASAAARGARRRCVAQAFAYVASRQASIVARSR